MAETAVAVPESQDFILSSLSPSLAQNIRGHFHKKLARRSGKFVYMWGLAAQPFRMVGGGIEVR
jgi:hypothetical protein